MAILTFGLSTHANADMGDCPKILGADIQKLQASLKGKGEAVVIEKRQFLNVGNGIQDIDTSVFAKAAKTMRFAKAAQLEEQKKDRRTKKLESCRYFYKSPTGGKSGKFTIKPAHDYDPPKK